jgi:hypothetical protein
MELMARSRVRTTEAKRILIWLLLAAVAALVSYAGMRGYLARDLLLNFANMYYC